MRQIAAEDRGVRAARLLAVKDDIAKNLAEGDVSVARHLGAPPNLAAVSAEIVRERRADVLGICP